MPDNSYLEKIQQLQSLLDRNLSMLLPADTNKTNIINNIKKIGQSFVSLTKEMSKSSLVDKEKFIKDISSQANKDLEDDQNMNSSNAIMPTPVGASKPMQKESKTTKITEMVSAASGAAQGAAGGIDLGSDEEENENKDEIEEILRKEIRESIQQLYKSNRKDFIDYYNTVFNIKEAVGKNNKKDTSYYMKYRIPNLEATGLNFAIKTYKQISQKIEDSLVLLQNPEDNSKFSKGLLKNIAQLCDKIEENMETGEPVEEFYVEPKTTGESVLVGVFQGNSGISALIDSDYRDLKTSPEQRKSYKEHLLNIIQKELMNTRRVLDKTQLQTPDMNKPDMNSDLSTKPDDNQIFDNELPEIKI